MSTKPHTPNVDDMRAAWVDYSMVSALASPVAEFDRFIAKVKADALREAVESARAVIDTGSEGDSAYHHGARYGQHRFADWLDVRADRIEREA